MMKLRLEEKGGDADAGFALDAEKRPGIGVKRVVDGSAPITLNGNVIREGNPTNDGATR